MMISAEQASRLPGAPERSPYFNSLRQRILHDYSNDGWQGLVSRVVALARRADAPWNEPDREEFLSLLGTALTNGEFLPNSPLLVNASARQPQLFACFALDSRRPMDEFLDTARQVHNGMGGVGYSLDGTLSPSYIYDFIQTVDADTVAHQAGRPRPASNAVTIPIDHPAAEALFASVRKVRVTNLNAGISDAFMVAVRAHDSGACALMDRLAASIHASGQPGVLFTDRIPRIALDEAAPFAANVCGEAPLAADESGLLGSVNLVQFVEPGPDGHLRLAEERLAQTVRMGIRFLDGMHDVHWHPSPQLRTNSLATRKVGLGIMGFAHLLALLDVRYGSAESLQFADRIGELLMTAARLESERLARVRGPFPAWSPESGDPPRRNATLVAIAGTATLALLTGTTGGLEPIFSHVARHRVIDDELVVLDPIAALFAEERGHTTETVRNRLMAGESLEVILGATAASLLPTASQISGEEHIAVQAAFQRRIDGGITKTINCGPETTVAQIRAWLELAYDDGCLGLTIYRDGSLDDQPVSRAWR